jgi:hypothetical protein
VQIGVLRTAGRLEHGEDMLHAISPSCQHVAPKLRALLDFLIEQFDQGKSA